MSNQNFQKAVSGSSTRRKVNIINKHIEVKSGKSGAKRYIDRLVFYKNDEILDESEIVMVMELISDPSILFPIPESRREPKLDGKFFVVKDSPHP